ncbi:MAG: L protein [Hailar virus]|uniref:RNA-directed RNA polymerase L n=1 Tax=Hailar virus TaxID=3070921 RepID=A0AA48XCN0_9VIRU|nr:MAG: L protein [Inner Mongolia sediment arena-like virus]QYF49514.1 MAG: L protein [Hailar virus]
MSEANAGPKANITKYLWELGILEENWWKTRQKILKRIELEDEEHIWNLKQILHPDREFPNASKWVRDDIKLLYQVPKSKTTKRDETVREEVIRLIEDWNDVLINSEGFPSDLMSYNFKLLGELDLLEAFNRLRGEVAEYVCCLKHDISYSAETRKETIGELLLTEFQLEIPPSLARLTPDYCSVEEHQISIYEFGLSVNRDMKIQSDTKKWKPLKEILEDQGFIVNLTVDIMSDLSEEKVSVYNTELGHVLNKINNLNTRTLRGTLDDFTKNVRGYMDALSEGYLMINDSSVHETDSYIRQEVTLEEVDQFFRLNLGEDYEMSLTEIMDLQMSQDEEFRNIEGWSDRQNLVSEVESARAQLNKELNRAKNSGRLNGEKGRFFKIPLSVVEEKAEILSLIQRQECKEWDLLRRDLDSSQQRMVKYLHLLDYHNNNKEVEELFFTVNDSVFDTLKLVENLVSGNQKSKLKKNLTDVYLKKACKDNEDEERKPSYKSASTVISQWMQAIEGDYKEGRLLKSNTHISDLASELRTIKTDKDTKKQKTAQELSSWIKRTDKLSEMAGTKQEDTVSTFESLSENLLKEYKHELRMLPKEEEEKEERKDPVLTCLGLTKRPLSNLIKRNKSLKKWDQYLNSCSLIARAICNSSYNTFKEPMALSTYHKVGNCVIYTNTKGNKAKKVLINTKKQYQTFKTHPERMLSVINCKEMFENTIISLLELNIAFEDIKLDFLCRMITNQSKRDQVSLQSLRYWCMACRSDYHRRGISAKMEWKILDRKDGICALENLKYMENLERATRKRQNRKDYTLRLGGHCSGKEVLNSVMVDIYICHLITKTVTEKDYELQKCFVKFIKPKLSFKDKECKKGTLITSKQQEINDFLQEANEKFSIPKVHRQTFINFLKWIPVSLKKQFSIAKNKAKETYTKELINPKSTVSQEKKKLDIDKWEAWILKYSKARASVLNPKVKEDDNDEDSNAYHLAKSLSGKICEVINLSLSDLRKKVSETTPENFISEHPEIVELAQGTVDILGTISRLSEEEGKTEDIDLLLTKLTEISLERGDWDAIAALLLMLTLKQMKVPSQNVHYKRLINVKSEKKKLKTTQRDSTTMSLLNFIDRKLNMAHTLLADIRKAETKKDIFQMNHYFGLAPKEQIGGERELYVGDVITKIKMKRVENFAREVSKINENSCLNVPSQESEFRTFCCNIMNSTDDENKTLYMTLDHSKWGPTQMCDLFYLLACELDPGLSPIKQILLKHILKEVEIPSSIVELTLKKTFHHPFTVTNSENEEIWNRVHRDYLEKNTQTIQAPFDMGQGILHNWSDFLGAMTEKYIMEKVIEKTKAEHPEIETITVKDMNTSDDSAAVIMASFHTGSSEAWKKTFLNCHHSFSLLLNKKTSEKSTADSKLLEFKSIFIENGVEIPAKIKQESAAMHNPCIDNLKDWTNTVINMSRDCVDHGSQVENLYYVIRSLVNFLSQCISTQGILEPVESPFPFLPKLTINQLILQTNRKILINSYLQSDNNRICMEASALVDKGLVEGSMTSLYDSLRSLNLPMIKSINTTAVNRRIELTPPFGRDKEREKKLSIRAALKQELPEDSSYKTIVRYLLTGASKISEKGLRTNILSSLEQGSELSVLSPFQKLQTIRFQARCRCLKIHNNDSNKVEIKRLTDIQWAISSEPILEILMEEAAVSAEPFKDMFINQTKGIGTKLRQPIKKFQIIDNRTDVDLSAECLEFIKRGIISGNKDAEKAWDFIAIGKNQRVRIETERWARLQLLLELNNPPMIEIYSSNRSCYRRCEEDFLDYTDIAVSSYIVSNEAEVTVISDSTKPSLGYIKTMVSTYLVVKSCLEPPFLITTEDIKEILRKITQISFTPLSAIFSTIRSSTEVNCVLDIILRAAACGRETTLKSSDLQTLKPILTSLKCYKNSKIKENGELEKSVEVVGVIRKGSEICKVHYKSHLGGTTHIKIQDQNYTPISEADVIKEISMTLKKNGDFDYLIQEIGKAKITRQALTRPMESVIEEDNFLYMSEGTICRKVKTYEVNLESIDLKYEELGISYSMETVDKIRTLHALEHLDLNQHQLEDVATMISPSQPFEDFWIKRKIRRLALFCQLIGSRTNTEIPSLGDWKACFNLRRGLLKTIGKPNHVLGSCTSVTVNNRSASGKLIMNLIKRKIEQCLTEEDQKKSELKLWEVTSKLILLSLEPVKNSLQINHWTDPEIKINSIKSDGSFMITFNRDVGDTVEYQGGIYGKRMNLVNLIELLRSMPKTPMSDNQNLPIFDEDDFEDEEDEVQEGDQDSEDDDDKFFKENEDQDQYQYDEDSEGESEFDKQTIIGPNPTEISSASRVSSSDTTPIWSRLSSPSPGPTRSPSPQHMSGTPPVEFLTSFKKKPP